MTKRIPGELLAAMVGEFVGDGHNQGHNVPEVPAALSQLAGCRNRLSNRLKEGGALLIQHH